MRRRLVPASAVGLALLLVACGGSARHARARTFTGTVGAGATTVRTRAATSAISRSATTPTSPSAAEIDRAARLTARQPGFTARVSATIDLPQLGGNAVTAVGGGRFDPRSRSGTLGLAVGLPGLLGLAGPLPTQVRLVGGEAYVQVPPDIADQLGNSAGWLAGSIATLGLGASLSPPDILREVARDATRRIAGQRSRVTIDPSTGLVRTIVLRYSVAGGYRVRVRLQLTGFGAQPATSAPDPARTRGLRPALRQLGF